MNSTSWTGAQHAFAKLLLGLAHFQCFLERRLPVLVDSFVWVQDEGIEAAGNVTVWQSLQLCHIVLISSSCMCMLYLLCTRKYNGNNQVPDPSDRGNIYTRPELINMCKGKLNHSTFKSSVVQVCSGTAVHLHDYNDTSSSVSAWLRVYLFTWFGSALCFSCECLSVL